jgi:hypothetical protein
MTADMLSLAALSPAPSRASTRSSLIYGVGGRGRGGGRVLANAEVRFGRGGDRRGAWTAAASAGWRVWATFIPRGPA